MDGDSCSSGELASCFTKETNKVVARALLAAFRYDLFPVILYIPAR